MPRTLTPFAPALALFSSLACAAPADTARAAAWFDAHRDRPPMLRQFLQRMPKGADLHSHVSGAVYAESYLKWAAEAHYCVDTEKLAFFPAPCAPGGKVVAAADLSGEAYGAMVDRMSTRNLAFAGRSGHDQFFSTFGSFGPAANIPGAIVAMQAELANRAAAEHIHYLELMTTFQGGAVRKLGAALPWKDETDLDRRHRWLLAHGLGDLVAAGTKELDELAAAYRTSQGCGTAGAQPGCAIPVRWLQQTTRTAPPEEVFAQLAYAFELARADGRVAGLNLVAPEDNAVALRDYRLQMDMLAFLSKRNPEVNIALHAGELALGLVPPEQLRNHIAAAVLVAGAKRIGHGVDIGFEDGALATMAAMKHRGVAAEICLTSNDVILGVKGRDHPLPDYLKAGVPVVLASDDQGVSRMDLSNEYLRAARDYGLSYRQLKDISRNSLSYSFLPGASLWGHKACARDIPGSARPSVACGQFLAGSEKARNQWTLEAAFDAFERSPDWVAARP